MIVVGLLFILLGWLGGVAVSYLTGGLLIVIGLIFEVSGALGHPPTPSSPVDLTYPDRQRPSTSQPQRSTGPRSSYAQTLPATNETERASLEEIRRLS
jgi:hypothetical protein